MMVRKSLKGLPDYPLPDGFRIRLFEKGDQNTWVRIHQETEGYHTVDPDLFTREFGKDLSKLQQRQFFIIDKNGIPIGTASAWDDNELAGRGFGRIHWVAIVPDYQGKGLAKALTSRVCHRFHELGHKQALVTTENFRLNAIHIYRKFGFEPFPRNEAEKEFWEQYTRELDKS